QWLASRGYAVLSVNFRGSTGFGKAFTNAADREWGGRMQDDLDDGVAWAVKEGIADPDRVGLFGASYGGYPA
ncbi:MAG: S9 family peptidase, partial [Mesorhizobium sp.]